ncbi:hypothetical protein V7112_11015 [Bacillus sp. JJ1566]|uniref:hypothetical protein n=1 Tax=Bacillus sp. JJ1566 TaxID=3122961 RepID=UPI003000F4DB
MLKDELKTKVHVLDDIDQLLFTLNKIDMQIKTEVDKYIHEEGHQHINQLKQLENELISLRKAYRNQNAEQAVQSEKEHSYHLTLSY